MPDAERKLRLKIEGDANPLKGTFTELNSVLGVAKQALGAVQGVWNETVKAYLEGADAVDGVARSTGMSAEESSRLVGVFKVLNLDTGLLTRAAVALRKEGLVPDIETLARLSDLFNRLTTPLEKNNFLIKNFGKAGMELGEIMEKGGDKIRAYAKSVSTVFSEEDIENAQEVAIGLKEIEDEWTALKNAVAKPIVMFIKSDIDIQHDFAAAAADSALVATNLGFELDVVQSRMQQQSVWVNKTTGELIVGKQPMLDYAAAHGVVADALRETNKLLGLTPGYAMMAGEAIDQNFIDAQYQVRQASKEGQMFLEFLDDCANKHVYPTIDLWINFRGGRNYSGPDVSKGNRAWSGTSTGGQYYSSGQVVNGYIYVNGQNTGQRPAEARGGSNLKPGAYEVGDVGTEGLIINEDGTVSVVPNERWNLMKSAGVHPRKGFYAAEGVDIDTSPQRATAFSFDPGGGTGESAHAVGPSVQTQAAIASIAASKANVEVAQETTRTLKNLVTELVSMLTSQGGIRY